MIISIILGIFPSFIIEYSQKRFSPSKFRIFEEKINIQSSMEKSTLKRRWIANEGRNRAIENDESIGAVDL